MAKQHWLDDEAGFGGMLRQGVGLCRVGLGRRWHMLLVTAAFACALAGWLVYGSQQYAPRVVLRVVEADREPGEQPRLKRQLAEYVRQAVFTSAPLFEVIRRHGLYPSLMRNNARAALDSFKDDILVEVYQNYFVEERARGDLPRSARLSVGYRSTDAALALVVTRELGALVVRHEMRARREQALAAASRAERARDTLQLALQRRSEEVLALRHQISLAATVDPGLQVELIGLLGSLGALERQVETAVRRAATLDLGAALEKHGMGLYFEVVDDGTLPGRAGQLPGRLWIGAVSLALGLPLLALGIGAFCPKREPA